MPSSPTNCCQGTTRSARRCSKVWRPAASTPSGSDVCGEQCAGCAGGWRYTPRKNKEAAGDAGAAQACARLSLAGYATSFGPGRPLEAGVAAALEKNPDSARTVAFGVRFGPADGRQGDIRALPRYGLCIFGSSPVRHSRNSLATRESRRGIDVAPLSVCLAVHNNRPAALKRPPVLASRDVATTYTRQVGPRRKWVRLQDATSRQHSSTDWRNGPSAHHLVRVRIAYRSLSRSFGAPTVHPQARTSRASSTSTSPANYRSTTSSAHVAKASRRRRGHILESGRVPPVRRDLLEGTAASSSLAAFDRLAQR